MYHTTRFTVAGATCSCAVHQCPESCWLNASMMPQCLKIIRGYVESAGALRPLQLKHAVSPAQLCTVCISCWGWLTLLVYCLFMPTWQLKVTSLLSSHASVPNRLSLDDQLQ